MKMCCVQLAFLLANPLACGVKMKVFVAKVVTIQQVLLLVQVKTNKKRSESCFISILISF